MSERHDAAEMKEEIVSYEGGEDGGVFDYVTITNPGYLIFYYNAHHIYCINACTSISHLLNII